MIEQPLALTSSSSTEWPLVSSFTGVIEQPSSTGVIEQSSSTGMIEQSSSTGMIEQHLALTSAGVIVQPMQFTKDHLP